MASLRRMLKDIVPARVRDGIRYVVNPGYRRMVQRGQQRARQQGLVAAASSHLWGETCGRIASGPFKGLRYIQEAVGSQWAPKLLGTYEMELAPVIEGIIGKPPAQVVNIGAAEGYYAVGLAWRMSSTRVVAFEVQQARHKLLKDFAAANGVAERIEVRGACLPDSLNDALQAGASTVVICDVEGAEVELLDPHEVPALRLADILVELHDFVNPDVESVLRERFAPTHGISEIRARPRRTLDWTAKVQFGRDATLALLDERRPGGMRWFWMCRRAEAN